MMAEGLSLREIAWRHRRNCEMHSISTDVEETRAASSSSKKPPLSKLPLRREAGGWDLRSSGWRCALSLFDRGRRVRWTLFAIAVFLLARRLDDGAHPVVAFGVGFDAVDLAFEAGEALAELLHGEDKLDDWGLGAAEALAGHRHGYAGRVGDEHDRGDPACHLVEADLLGLVA